MKMKKLISIALLAVACAAPASAQAIGGKYRVEGTNINGTTYSGEALVTLTSETTCEIQWITGPTTSNGICMRNEDSFAAGYQIGNDVGLVIYKVMKDGSMKGLWTIAGNGGAGTEDLIPE
jgi:hypothetical protein